MPHLAIVSQFVEQTLFPLCFNHINYFTSITSKKHHWNDRITDNAYVQKKISCKSEDYSWMLTKLTEWRCTATQDCHL